MNEIEKYIETIYQKSLTLESVDAIELSENSKKNIDVIVAASERIPKEY